MKKTVLIPVDFTTASLLPVEYIVQHSQADEITVVLVHFAALSNSITDLLFYSAEDEIKKYNNAEFTNACNDLMAKFDKIRQIRIEPFHGNTSDAFENFVWAKKAEEILIPRGYTFVLCKDAVDPLRFIMQSSLPVIEVSAASENHLQKKNTALI